MPDPTADLLMEQRRRVAALRLSGGTSWADKDLVFEDPLVKVLNLEQVSRAAGEARDRTGISRDASPLHGPGMPIFGPQMVTKLSMTTKTVGLPEQLRQRCCGEPQVECK